MAGLSGITGCSHFVPALFAEPRLLNQPQFIHCIHSFISSSTVVFNSKNLSDRLSLGVIFLGENEVPSEDALILHLQLAKGQEKLVEALRAQQMVIRDLQQKLVDQQEALLSQQREILDQQRRMYEQMDMVKAQYSLVSDTVKQVSFQGLQGELQSYFESHLAGLQSQARSHLQKSYTTQKMDMDSKVMDVVREANFPQPLLGCPSPCGSEEFCDFQRDPPQCEKCTMCPPGFFLISQCSPTADRMCQVKNKKSCLCSCGGT